MGKCNGKPVIREGGEEYDREMEGGKKVASGYHVCIS